MKQLAIACLCWRLLATCAVAQAPKTRSEAIEALAARGPAAAPQLAKILAGYDDDARVLATLALGRMGEAARCARSGQRSDIVAGASG